MPKSAFEKRILILGDSTTTGYPYSKEISWTNGLQKAFPNIEFLIEAHNGATLGNLLPIFEKNLSNHHFDFVFLMIGLNECYDKSISVDEFEGQIIFVKNILKKRKTPLLLALPIDFADFDDEGDKPKLVKTKNILMAQNGEYPLAPSCLLEEEDYFDGVHPSEKGYKKMEKHFINYFQTLF